MLYVAPYWDITLQRHFWLYLCKHGWGLVQLQELAVRQLAHCLLAAVQNLSAICSVMGEVRQTLGRLS